jgi:hypothetical protein
LTILEEAPNPERVEEIKADPSGSESLAKISACGGESLRIAFQPARMSSLLHVEVLQPGNPGAGRSIEFIGTDGSAATATIEAGFTLTFDPDTFFSFSARHRATPIQ